MKQKRILVISILSIFLSTISISAQNIFTKSKIEQTANIIKATKQNTFLTEERKLPLLSSLAVQFLDLTEQKENKEYFIKFFQTILNNINSNQNTYTKKMYSKLDRHLKLLFGNANANSILHGNQDNTFFISAIFIGAIKMFFKKHLEIINNTEVTKDQNKRIFWINLIGNCILESVEK